MFKLLPPEVEIRVMREYTTRRLTVFLIGFSVALGIGAVGLLPSFILAKARQAEVVNRARILDDAGIKGDEEGLQVWLTEINRRLVALDPKLDVDRPSEIFEKIVAEKIVGIRIMNLNWQKDTKGVTQLRVSGMANTRAALIDFDKRLENSGHFSSVILPVSNLTRDKDLEFEIELTPKTP